MKKRLLVFFVILVIFIYGCDQVVDEDGTAEERLAEDNYEETSTDKEASNNYNSLEENIDILLEMGNRIGESHYDELEASVNKLEENGEDVAVLRKKLSELNVASSQQETQNGYEEFVPGKSKENLEHEDSKISEEGIEQNTQIQTIRRNEIPTEQEKEQLPDCENVFFSTPPVDMSNIVEITPLGNLGPPGHTFPTDHTYLGVGERGSGKAFDLFAPADVYITSVSYSKGITQDPIDYTIFFALCKDVIGYFNHVKTISGLLDKITEKKECEDYESQAEGSCTKLLFEKVDEGTLLGEVGLKQGNFDFGLFDLRKELNFVNPVRHPTRTRFIQCAYEYYRQDLQKQFFDLIKRDDAQQCGVTMQDVPGTLKGTWFHETSPKEYVVDWNVYLAFVQDNEFPDVEVVSVAGIITDPSKFEFNPRDSGFINREFSQVKVDGNVYCYKAEDVEKFQQSKPTGKIIVQLISDTQLKIEHKSGNCGGSESFNNPSIYNR